MIEYFKVHFRFVVEEIAKSWELSKNEQFLTFIKDLIEEAYIIKEQPCSKTSFNQICPQRTNLTGSFVYLLAGLKCLQ